MSSTCRNETVRLSISLRQILTSRRAKPSVNGSSFLVVATTGDPDANGIVDDVTAEFGGGGGGGSTFAQGGGLDEEPPTVVEYVRNHA